MSGYDALFGNGEAQPAEVIETPQAAPEVQPAPQPEPSGEPVLATPPATEPAPVAQDAAPPAARNEWTVPGHTLLSEREKRQAAERRYAEAQQRLDEIARQQAEASQPRPDPLLDSEAYATHVENLVEQRVGEVQSTYEQRLAQVSVKASERYWSERLEPEEWAGFNDWLRTLPPQARESLKRHDDPYGVALPKYREVKTFETLGGKTPQEWLAERIDEEAAKRGFVKASAQEQPATLASAATAPALAAPVAQPASPQAPPRRAAPSLADVVGSTASSDLPLSGYDALFKR